FTTRSVTSVGGELRVVVTSLEPLLSRHTTVEVLWFLRELTRRVAAARGMGHYRYAGSLDDLSALPLESLFDGFIDLREGTRAEHRLSIPDVVSTEYVSL
ncbi:MAG: hypothetical protein R3324_21055, partial [Halobacteriales archaeon]|nr:hypothetical protein [Halobacteriales archaeon]